MRAKVLLIASMLAFLSVSYAIPFSGASIGEFAGHLRYNLSIGSTQTQQMTIFNAGNQTIYFKIQLPQFTYYPANASQANINTTYPIVTVSPMNGSLAPQQNRALNITVTLPTKNNLPGMEWAGIVSAYEVSQAAQSGASVNTGVGKIITIVAYPQTGTNLGQILPILIVVVVVAAGVGGYLAFRRRATQSRARTPIKTSRATRRAAPSPRRRTPPKRARKARKRSAQKRRTPPRRRARR